MDLFDRLAGLSQPIPQAIGFAIAGFACLCFRRYRTAAALFAGGVLWLTLCATPVFAGWLRWGLEKQYPALPASSYPNADLIIVLGGGKLPNLGNNERSQANPALDTRIGFGLELIRKKRARAILVSGGRAEALKMAHLLEEQGVPAQEILVEDVSLNTHENALYSANMLNRAACARILLVTSPIHMRRALASYQRQGLCVIPAPAIVPDTSNQSQNKSWLPNPITLVRTGRYLREYFGLWAYRLLGWA